MGERRQGALAAEAADVALVPVVDELVSVPMGVVLVDEPVVPVVVDVVLEPDVEVLVSVLVGAVVLVPVVLPLGDSPGCLLQAESARAPQATNANAAARHHEEETCMSKLLEGDGTLALEQATCPSALPRTVCEMQRAG